MEILKNEQFSCNVNSAEREWLDSNILLPYYQGYSQLSKLKKTELFSRLRKAETAYRNGEEKIPGKAEFMGYYSLVVMYLKTNKPKQLSNDKLLSIMKERMESGQFESTEEQTDFKRYQKEKMQERAEREKEERLKKEERLRAYDKEKERERIRVEELKEYGETIDRENA